MTRPVRITCGMMQSRWRPRPGIESPSRRHWHRGTVTVTVSHATARVTVARRSSTGIRRGLRVTVGCRCTRLRQPGPGAATGRHRDCHAAAGPSPGRVVAAAACQCLRHGLPPPLAASSTFKLRHGLPPLPVPPGSATVGVPVTRRSLTRTRSVTRDCQSRVTVTRRRPGSLSATERPLARRLRHESDSVLSESLNIRADSLTVIPAAGRGPGPGPGRRGRESRIERERERESRTWRERAG